MWYCKVWYYICFVVILMCFPACCSNGWMNLIKLTDNSSQISESSSGTSTTSSSSSSGGSSDSSPSSESKSDFKTLLRLNKYLIENQYKSLPKKLYVNDIRTRMSRYEGVVDSPKFMHITKSCEDISNLKNVNKCVNIYKYSDVNQSGKKATKSCDDFSKCDDDSFSHDDITKYNNLVMQILSKNVLNGELSSSSTYLIFENKIKIFFS